MIDAQQRLKQKMKEEEERGKVQHLRNPLSVAQQLKKHLQNQKDVQQRRFNRFVGPNGQSALQKINRVRTRPQLVQPPLRFQSRSLSQTRIGYPKRVRSATSGLRRKRKLTHLRIKNHFGNSSHTACRSPVGIQQTKNGMVNILVSHKPLPSSIKKQMSTLKQSSRITRGGRFSRSVSRNGTPSNFQNHHQISRS